MTQVPSRRSELATAWSLAPRPDVDPSAYDMEDGGTAIRLSRLTDGRWRFDELVIADDFCIGGSQEVHGQVLLDWLNDEAEKIERRASA